MTRKEGMTMNPDLRFQNITESKLSFDEVVHRILRFMAQDPKAHFHFAIGTDSQVHQGCTKFITGIIIRRLGKGAWACYRQVIVPRELTSLKEKLTMETSLSQEMACYFSVDAVRRMEEQLLPYVYQGAVLETFIDIDAGTEPFVNKTSLYVQEMVARVESMGMYAARVKPDSYCASSYANRYTKKPVRRKVM
ncbi:ribonuclease H-like YkuK family protein [Paenibacillus rigui]|nr:ribonuclease H-like YkuK family protein [Paenibacillus rigui]